MQRAARLRSVESGDSPAGSGPGGPALRGTVRVSYPSQRRSIVIAVLHTRAATACHRYCRATALAL